MAARSAGEPAKGGQQLQIRPDLDGQLLGLALLLLSSGQELLALAKNRTIMESGLYKPTAASQQAHSLRGKCLIDVLLGPVVLRTLSLAAM